MSGAKGEEGDLIPCENLGNRISVEFGYTDQLGTCNFCDRNNLFVFQLSGMRCQVRICNQCLQVVRRTR